LRDERQGRSDTGVAEVADADLERLGGKRVGRHDTQANCAKQSPDHSVSLAVPIEKGL
jgi:hypothetical protein